MEASGSEDDDIETYTMRDFNIPDPRSIVIPNIVAPTPAFLPAPPPAFLPAPPLPPTADTSKFGKPDDFLSRFNVPVRCFCLAGDLYYILILRSQGLRTQLLVNGNQATLTFTHEWADSGKDLVVRRMGVGSVDFLHHVLDKTVIEKIVTFPAKMSKSVTVLSQPDDPFIIFHLKPEPEETGPTAVEG